MKKIRLAMLLTVGALALLPGAAAAATTERVSVDSVENEATGGDSITAAISADGRFVAFNSDAVDLVSGDTNGLTDIFLRDRSLGTTERLSVDSAEAEATGGSSRYAAISADGRFVAFESAAVDLVSGDTNAFRDIFVRDRSLGTTERVSVDSAEAQATGGDSDRPAISADGRYVAFASGATDLVGDDGNGVQDVFVRDRTLGTTERVSIDSGEAEATGTSEGAAVSADGRFVAFGSDAVDLVSGDANEFSDIFVRDRSLGTTERVSVDSAEAEATDGASFVAAINGDGRFVAFTSNATDLVANDTNGFADIFVRDRTLGTTERVNVDAAEAQATGGTSGSSTAITSNGRFVAFESLATNLAGADTNDSQDIFLRDRSLGTTERVSVDSAGAEATGGDSYGPVINSDGRFVAFNSGAVNLVGSDANGFHDVFVRERPPAGTTERANVDSAEAQATGGDSFRPAISGDGRFVAFHSDAVDLVSGDGNGLRDIFVRDRLLGTTERVSVDSGEAEAIGGGSRDAAISADGRFVAFQSAAINLVTGDANALQDIFVRDRTLGTTERVSIDSAEAEATGGSSSTSTAISADGRFVTFQSSAINLVGDDHNDLDDIFVRDRTLGTTERVSVDSDEIEAADGPSADANISADGRFVAFESEAINLVTGDTNAMLDVFVRDRTLGTTERVNVDNLGSQTTNQGSDAATISAGGRFVAFTSVAQDLVADDTNNAADVFVRDRTLNTTERVSVDSAEAELTGGDAFNPTISADGRFVAYYSDAINLVSGDTNGFRDVFVRDRLLGSTERVSVDDAGAQATDGDSENPAISADARFVAFNSGATDLVSDDTNTLFDIFVRALATDVDSDGDGYTDEDELSIGTHPGYPCGNGGWPSNLVTTGGSLNKLDIFDLVSFVAPVRLLDKSPGPGSPYNPRWDLAPGPNTPFPNHISIFDITTMLSGIAGGPAYPPMLGGSRAFDKLCPLSPQ